MTQAARVTSVEALERLHEALAKFGQEGQEALATAEGEARRGLEAIKDRLAFWMREVNRRQEEVNRARSDLAHRRSLHDDRRTGAVEQEIALARAQQRLREAEEKVVFCRRWMIHLPDAVEEFEGPARQLAGMLDADLKVSLAKLQEKIDTLHAYAALAVPSGNLPSGMSSAPPGVGMPPAENKAPLQEPEAPAKDAVGEATPFEPGVERSGTPGGGRP